MDEDNSVLENCLEVNNAECTENATILTNGDDGDDEFYLASTGFDEETEENASNDLAKSSKMTCDAKTTNSHNLIEERLNCDNAANDVSGVRNGLKIETILNSANSAIGFVDDDDVVDGVVNGSDEDGAAADFSSLNNHAETIENG